MRDPLHWVPIKYKLPLTMSVLYVLAFGIGGYLVTTDTRSEIGARIRRSLETEALLAKRVVDGQFELACRRVEDFASDGFIRVEVESLLANKDEALRAASYERLVRHFGANKLPLVGFFANAAILDSDGHRVLQVRPSFPEDLPAARPTPATTLSSLFAVEPARAYRSCVVTTPLASIDGGRTIGYLQILLDLERWVRDIEFFATPDRSGRHSFLLHDPSGHSLTLTPDAQAWDTPGSVSGVGVLDGSGADGARRVLRYETALKTPGWRLDLATDYDLAMAPLASMTRRFVGIGAALLTLSLVLLFFPARFLVRPLLQLRQAAQEMAAGDERVRVIETTSKDEIGDLSRAFNGMAHAVEERSQRLKVSAEELQRQQALIRFERDRLEVVIRSMQDGLFIMDDVGEVTYSNAAGHGLIERLGRTSPRCQRLRCSDAKVAAEGCLSCLAGKDREPGSCTLKLEDRVYEIHVTPLPSRTGRPKETVYVSRDVTDRLAQSERQAHQERMYVVGELAAVVAHEMNNPMAAIVMFSQMLKAGLESDSELERHADVILRNADACRRTVSSLLEMSAFPTPDVGEFSVDALLADVSDFLRPLIERTAHTLHVEPSGDDAIPQDIKIHGDEVQLRQVLVNLVMNGVQSSSDQGGGVIIRSFRRGEFAVVEVEDDGPGIPPEIRDRVFEPFFSTKPPGMGTGLGLPTSRRIVAAHGGTLSLTTSEPGRTIFSVQLPLHGAPRLIPSLHLEGVVPSHVVNDLHSDSKVS